MNSKLSGIEIGATYDMFVYIAATNVVIPANGTKEDNIDINSVRPSTDANLTSVFIRNSSASCFAYYLAVKDNNTFRYGVRNITSTQLTNITIDFIVLFTRARF